MTIKTLLISSTMLFGLIACSPAIETEKSQTLPAERLMSAPSKTPASHTAAHTDATNFKGMSLAQDLNTKTYSLDQRFERLEKAVMALQETNKSDEEFQILVKKLESFLAEIKANKNTPIAPATMPKEATAAPLQMVKPHAPKPHKKSAPKNTKKPMTSGVAGIRIGEHKDRTRIVFDLASKTNMRVELDQAENLLLIEFQGIKWNTASAKTLSTRSPLVASYSATSMGDGNSRVIIPLKKSTQILDQKILPPSGRSPYHRAYIDLKK